MKNTIIIVSSLLLLLTCRADDPTSMQQRFPADANYLLRDCRRCHSADDRIALFNKHNRLKYTGRKDLEDILKFNHALLGDLDKPETEAGKRDREKALKLILGKYK